ncbi:MAG TPA: site-specific integrase [Candidatus Acidoferrales bacterium]|jgi:integrase|nr:site-specific integrase [Candidatus Acidoferrales bacterium]
MAVHRRGKFYRYDFWFEGRRFEKSTKCTNKSAALLVEAKRKAELVERRAGLSRKPLPPKFEEYVPQFLAWSRQQRRPKTYALHKTNCDTLLRYFSGQWLDEIRPGMVEGFKLARAREERRNANDGSTVSAATVNRAFTTLKLIFNHARRCGLAVENPTDGIALLEENGGRMRVVSFEEELSYFQAAGQPLQDIARVILDTGMRPEEVYRVEVENLDFQRRTIFNPFGKTKAAKRTIPMTEHVWELLRKRVIETTGNYVFPSPTNLEKPIGSVRKAHDAAVARAGIQDHFRLYDLRHTFATRFIAAGGDLPTLAAILGHTKIQMTMRYVHPAEQQKRQAMGRLETYRVEEMRKVTETLKGSLRFPLQ